MLLSATPLTPPSSSPRRAAFRELLRYLLVVHGRAGRGGLIEVRYRDPARQGRWRQRFVGAARPGCAARAILALGRVTDTYVGVAARQRRGGGKDAIDEVHVVWVDLDGVPLVDVDTLAVPPGIVVRSGSAGHRHLYWPLSEPVTIARAELANRRLAAYLGGDVGAVCNVAAVLRAPGTSSFKRAEPVGVTLERLRTERHELDEIVAGLPPHGGVDARPAGRMRHPGADAVDPLLHVQPAHFAELLVGRVPGRDRKICCSFHEDRTPSLHLYETGEQGWYCFGCGRGGDIYDFAGALWGLKTRGRDYLELRRRLSEQLLPLSIVSHLTRRWTP
jgi:hypothetical protein